MTNVAESNEAQTWTPLQVYVMAAVCLIVGVALGYLFRGSEVRPVQASPAAAMPSTAVVPSRSPTQAPSLDDMKRMADKQAEPLLTKLKTDPKNSALLNQVGTIYKATHQFKEAREYYQKAVDADPKNVAARTDLASCMYYEGDADGAIGQLQQSLRYQPADANSLFNLGILRLKAKHDSSGAVAAWQQLLRSNPKLSAEKKSEVQQLIAQARSQKLNP